MGVRRRTTSQPRRSRRLISRLTPAGSVESSPVDGGDVQRVLAEGSHRTCTRRGQGRVLQSFLSSPEKRGQMAGMSRSTPPQPEDQMSEVQDGVDERCSPASRAWRLHDFGGCVGRVSSRSGTYGFSKVPSVYLEGEGMAVPGNAFRPQHSPTGVHETDAARGTASSRGRSSPRDISGRYPYHCAHLTGFARVHAYPDPYSQGFRLRDQPAQEFADTLTCGRVSWVHDQQYNQDHQRSFREDPWPSAFHSASSSSLRGGLSFSQVPCIDGRQDCSSVPRSGSRSPALALPASLSTGSTFGCWLGRPGTSERGGQDGASMVVGTSGAFQRENLRAAGGDCDADDGRLRFGMGRLSHYLRTGDTGDLGVLGLRPGPSVDQRPGDARIAPQSGVLSSSSSGEDSPLAHRQRHRAGIRSQRGRTKPQVDHDSETDLANDFNSQDRSPSEVSSRESQRDGRSSESDAPRSDGLAASPKMVPSRRGPVGPSHGRSLRNRSKRAAPSVLRGSSPTRVRRSKRPRASVGRRGPVDSSAILSDRSCSAQASDGRGSERDALSSCVDGSELVASDDEHDGRHPDPSSDGRVSISSGPRGPRSSPPGVAGGRVQAVRDNHKRLGISEATTNLAIRSWRDSTNASADTHWAAWVRFCDDSVDPLDPPDSTLADFIAFLSTSKGLKGSTLDVAASSVRSTIAVANNVGGALLSAVRKGANRINPGAPRYESVWEVGPVLSHIHGWGPNDDLDARHLLAKGVALWLLAASLRPSDLARVGRVRIDADEVRFAVFASKTSAADAWVERVPIRGVPGDPLICPLEWTRHYLSRTADARKSPDSFLILPIAGGGDRLSPNRISNIASWVLKEAGIVGFTGGSFRHASATAFSKTLGTDTAVRRGTWRSPGVAAHYYIRDKTATDTGAVFSRD
eukprot:Rmarinus@m.5300